jgi:hypothetical protein
MHSTIKTLLGTTAALASLGAASGAHAASPRAVFSLAISTEQPGAPADLTLNILHRDPANPEGKPPAVRKNVITTPPGTRINDAAVTRCEATDAEFYAMGRDACPADSKVGEGTLTVMTGFGAPIDPIVNDVTLFNSEGHVIELVSAHGTNMTEAVDRATVKDGTITAAPPSLPGGPPDGETVIRSIEFHFKNVKGNGGNYITTPQTCPASGHWTSTGTFTYADGYTESDPSDAPCEPASESGAKSDASRPCLKSRRMTIRAPATGGARIKRLEVVINGKVARRVAVGTRRIRVDLRHRRVGIYKVCIRATTRSGRRLTHHRTVRLCP